MLLSAAITLDPLDEAAAHTHARQVQCWFKDALEAADAALFAHLHQPNTTRAYTLSEVYAPRSGYPAWLRITSMDADLSALLTDRLLPDLRAAGELILDPRANAARFAVRTVDLGVEDRPLFADRAVDVHDPATWAGRTSYAALVNAAIKQPKGRQLRLHVHSCTSFRLNAPDGFKSNLPLPVPRYVFQSWLRQWEELGPANLLVTMAPFLEHYVWLTYHRLRSVNVAFGGGTRGKTVGFVGEAAFGWARRGDLPDDLRRDWQHYVDMLHLLAGIGFYCGTGIRTTHGLGQTLPLQG